MTLCTLCVAGQMVKPQTVPGQLSCDPLDATVGQQWPAGDLRGHTSFNSPLQGSFSVMPVVTQRDTGALGTW